MLVLSRKIQERVCIGDNITLTILQVKGKTVRVGIEAPRSVRVVRGELPPKESPETAEEELETQEADETQPPAVAGNIEFAVPSTAGASRLRDLVLKVTSANSSSNAV